MTGVLDERHTGGCTVRVSVQTMRRRLLLELDNRVSPLLLPDDANAVLCRLLDDDWIRFRIPVIE